jgi:hypothetical protein
MENKVENKRENKRENNGIQTFINFANNVPEGLSNFDYFTLLDHISQNKLDRDLIAAIFCESKINIFNIFYYRK